MSLTSPRPQGAAARRQADPRFIRAEIDLKRQFTQLFDVEEYVDPPPTEYTVAQTRARRRRLQSKIDGALCTRQTTTSDPLAVAAAKRQADPRFKRAEYDIEEECKRVLGAHDYEGPSPMETTEKTSRRRQKMRRKIFHARNPREKKTMGAGQFNLSSFGDAESINVTDILLGACGIKDVQRAACSYFKRSNCSMKDPHVVLPYTMGVSDQDDTEKKEKNECCHFGCSRLGYCCEIGDNGMHFYGGYRQVFVQELGCWLDISHWVGCNLLKQINIDGETLRGLVDASTGGRKGLQMKREVYIFFHTEPSSDSSEVIMPSATPKRYLIDPDPTDIKRGRGCSVDIEDILDISDGIITFDERPDKKKFKVTGEGGKPSYATGSIFGARYNGIIEDNFHCFEIDLEHASKQCKKNNILSAEIHINGSAATTLDESDWTESAIACKEGKLYKHVAHFWEASYWYDMLRVEVVYGPLPPPKGTIVNEDESDIETEMEEDQDPYNLLMRHKNMKIDFVELSFEENVLKKGGTLHHIALRDCSSDNDEEN